MTDFEEDIAEDILEMRGVMDDYVNEIHSNIDSYIDGEIEDLKYVEDVIEESYEVYEEINNQVTMIMQYRRVKNENSLDEELKDSEMKRIPADSPFPIMGYEPEDTEPRSELGIESKQLIEFIPLQDAKRDYEDAVFRYLGVRDEVETLNYSGLNNLLEDEDIELPGNMERETFKAAEILE